jgi:hypothetical protein
VEANVNTSIRSALLVAMAGAVCVCAYDAQAVGLGTAESPFVVEKRLVSAHTETALDDELGTCTTLTLELELSAPGMEREPALETIVACDGGASGKAPILRSANVVQYAPAPSYTCARGQGLRSNWAGGGTIQEQTVSYERGGSFYTAYGSGIGMTMGATLSWSMRLFSTDRIYAALMRTSGALSGTGTSCF